MQDINRKNVEIRKVSIYKSNKITVNCTCKRTQHFWRMNDICNSKFVYEDIPTSKRNLGRRKNKWTEHQPLLLITTTTTTTATWIFKCNLGLAEYLKGKSLTTFYPESHYMPLLHPPQTCRHHCTTEYHCSLWKSRLLTLTSWRQREHWSHISDMFRKYTAHKVHVMKYVTLHCLLLQTVSR